MALLNMTSAKSNTKATVTVSDFENFEYAPRTVNVNLAEIKTKAMEIFGPKIAIAWSVKFALGGLKLKPGQYIKISGVTHTDADFTKMISDEAKNPGYASAKKASGGIAKVSDKKVVSAKRMVRAFACDISKLIQAKKVSLPEDQEARAKACNLPVHYAFIDSWYGMDDGTLDSNKTHIAKFCVMFDELIATAHANGWMEGAAKHSHLQEFVNYCAWRGLSVIDS